MPSRTFQPTIYGRPAFKFEVDVLGEIYTEDFANFRKPATKILDWLGEHSPAVIEDILVCLGTDAVGQDSEYYRDDIREGEALSADALVFYFEKLSARE